MKTSKSFKESTMFYEVRKQLSNGQSVTGDAQVSHAQMQHMKGSVTWPCRQPARDHMVMVKGFSFNPPPPLKTYPTLSPATCGS